MIPYLILYDFLRIRNYMRYTGGGISIPIYISCIFLELDYLHHPHPQHVTIFSSFFLIFGCILAIANGYPTFVISIAAIGLVTAVIGDVAGHLGCFIYLKDCVNAIGFVALGTSVPG